MARPRPLARHRHAGVDAQHVSSRKEQGIMAGETLGSLVPPRVRLVNVKPGKFAGRFVATVMADTRDLAEAFRGKRASASLKPRSRETRPYRPRFIEAALNGDTMLVEVSLTPLPRRRVCGGEVSFLPAGGLCNLVMPVNDSSWADGMTAFPCAPQVPKVVDFNEGLLGARPHAMMMSAAPRGCPSLSPAGR